MTVLIFSNVLLIVCVISRPVWIGKILVFNAVDFNDNSIIVILYSFDLSYSHRKDVIISTLGEALSPYQNLQYNDRVNLHFVKLKAYDLYCRVGSNIAFLLPSFIAAPFAPLINTSLFNLFLKLQREPFLSSQ